MNTRIRFNTISIIFVTSLLSSLYVFTMEEPLLKKGKKETIQKEKLIPLHIPLTAYMSLEPQHLTQHLGSFSLSMLDPSGFTYQELLDQRKKENLPLVIAVFRIEDPLTHKIDTHFREFYNYDPQFALPSMYLSIEKKLTFFIDNKLSLPPYIFIIWPEIKKAEYLDSFYNFDIKNKIIKPGFSRLLNIYQPSQFTPNITDINRRFLSIAAYLPFLYNNFAISYAFSTKTNVWPHVYKILKIAFTMEKVSPETTSYFMYVIIYSLLLGAIDYTHVQENDITYILNQLFLKTSYFDQKLEWLIIPLFMAIFGKFDAAWHFMDILDKKITSNINRPFVHLMKARLYMHQNRDQDALKELTFADAEYKKESPPPTESPMIFSLLLGWITIKNQSSEQKINFLEPFFNIEFEKVQPSNINAYLSAFLYAIQVYLEQNNKSKAQNLLNQFKNLLNKKITDQLVMQYLEADTWYKTRQLFLKISEK